MKVKNYGFSLVSTSNKISVQNLVELMISESGMEDSSKANIRRLYAANVDDDFAAGLVVTVRDQRRFCELHGAGGGFTINVQNLTGDQKLMEFNFFVLNKTNGLGLYQHYHQSCSPGVFFDYLKARFSRLRKADLEAAVEQLKNSGAHTGKAEKALRKERKGALECSFLLRKDALSDVLSKFKRIRQFHYQYETLQPEHTAGLPIAPYVLRKRESVTFTKTVEVGPLAKAIQAMVDQFELRSGRVSVTEETADDEIPLSIQIADIPDNFGEQEYDALVAALHNLDVLEFHAHTVISDMLKICKEECKHIFLKVVKEG